MKKIGGAVAALTEIFCAPRYRAGVAIFFVVVFVLNGISQGIRRHEDDFIRRLKGDEW